MGYVCAFRGRRDSYQVPIALAEAGRLDVFITDLYCGAVERVIARWLPDRLSEIVHGRHHAQIPQDRVRRLRSIAIGEAAARISRVSSARLYDVFDPMYGRAAAREAHRCNSDLLMYSSHAWDAFTASYRRTPRKVLFQFHPHYGYEAAILEKDRQASAVHGIYFAGQLENLGTAGGAARKRGDAAWQLADHVVCASNFTKLSLVKAGANPSLVSVVPYGVPANLAVTTRDRSQNHINFHALFVGSGLQRKGLHHLLLAWRRARLPVGSRLTVVSRIIDQGLAHQLHDTDGVRYLKGVTQAELRQLYRTATVFVMPSLIEGFGQVYLEALSHGLPVIGTRNTCLPDLGGESDGVFVTTPGAVDELTGLLERLAMLLDNNSEIRNRARECASRFTWERFRSRLRELI
jgi:glycosyltransferase involved in cell wall biosynthesis